MKIQSAAVAAALAAATTFVSPANAQVTVLDFEGVDNLAPVGDFYASQGFTFSGDTLALVDGDEGGSGNIANEPSGKTVMFFLDSNNAILNANNGFSNGFSFFYSSATAATVSVYDGLNGTGNVLASLNLVAQNTNNCSGDPTGTFCNWTAVGATFAGVGRSINFGGTANFTVYDDITFGSPTPGGAVPEPATWALMILGMGAIGGAMRRRRTTNASARLA